MTYTVLEGLGEYLGGETTESKTVDHAGGAVAGRGDALSDRVFPSKLIGLMTHTFELAAEKAEVRTPALMTEGSPLMPAR